MRTVLACFVSLKVMSIYFATKNTARDPPNPYTEDAGLQQAHLKSTGNTKLLNTKQYFKNMKQLR